MKKRNRVLALTVAAAMSASLLAGCGSSAQQGGAASSEAASTDTAASVSDGGEDNIIRVGVVCSMTGGSAIYDEGAQNAVAMAVEEINAGDSGYKIEIVNGGKVADDAKDAKQAMKRLQQGHGRLAGGHRGQLLLVGHTAHGRTGLQGRHAAGNRCDKRRCDFKRRSLTVPMCWKPAPSRFPAMRRSC